MNTHTTGHQDSGQTFKWYFLDYCIFRHQNTAAHHINVCLMLHTDTDTDTNTHTQTEERDKEKM